MNMLNKIYFTEQGYSKPLPTIMTLIVVLFGVIFGIPMLDCHLNYDKQVQSLEKETGLRVGYYVISSKRNGNKIYNEHLSKQCKSEQYGYWDTGRIIEVLPNRFRVVWDCGATELVLPKEIYKALTHEEYNNWKNNNEKMLGLVSGSHKRDTFIVEHCEDVKIANSVRSHIQIPIIPWFHSDYHGVHIYTIGHLSQEKVTQIVKK